MSQYLKRSSKQKDTVWCPLGGDGEISNSFLRFRQINLYVYLILAQNIRFRFAKTGEFSSYHFHQNKEGSPNGLPSLFGGDGEI